MLKTGGKLLGQGAHGCVFHPSIDCADGSNSDKYGEYSRKSSGVSKIFPDDDSWIAELTQAKRVAEIDLNAEYTNPMVKTCSTKRKSIQEDQNNNECVWIKDGRDDTKWPQIIYEHKGVDFEEYIEKKEYNLKDVIGHLVRYAKGIAHFNRENYSHLDIKEPNMLITDSSKALLIDFGMSRDTNTIYHEDNEWFLEHMYVYYPPEFRFYMKQAYDGVKEITDLYDDSDDLYIGIYKKLNYKNPGLGTETYERMLNDYKGTIKDIYNKTNLVKSEQDLNNVYNNEFSRQTDVFSFGIVILTTIHTVSRRIKINSEIFEKCVEIGKKATHVNPFKRDNIYEVVEGLKGLLAEISKVTAGKVTASKVTASKVTASKVTASKVTASKVTASKVTAAKVTASKVTASKVTASKVTASKDTLLKYKESDSINTLKKRFKGPTFTKVELCNLVDKYRMERKLKKLDKNKLSNALAKHITQQKTQQFLTQTPRKTPTQTR
jgi:serine/threonine protein kinase